MLEIRGRCLEILVEVATGIAQENDGNRTYLEIPQLGEKLGAVIESALVWFGLLVDDPMSADITSLSEFLATDIANKRPVASMASLMGL